MSADGYCGHCGKRIQLDLVHECAPGERPITYADGLRRAAEIANNVAATPPSNNSRHIDWQSGYQDGAMECAAAIEAEIRAHQKPGSET